LDGGGHGGRSEAEGAAALINDEGKNPRGAGHVAGLEDRPFPAVGFAFHDGDGAHALHREDVEDHEREADERREEGATVGPFGGEQGLA